VLTRRKLLLPRTFPTMLSIVENVLGRSSLRRVSTVKHAGFKSTHKSQMLLRGESRLNFSGPEGVTLKLVRNRICRVLVLIDREREVTSIKLVVLDSL